MDGRAAQLVSLARSAGCTIAAAESCTGGMVSAAVTAVPGASAVFPGGVVSYACSAKEQLLGVNPETLRQYTAVSAPVARGMAEGVRALFAADYGLSVTGYAGPDGGPGEPVGTVYIGVASARGSAVHRHVFSGDRAAVREAATEAAIAHLCDAVAAEHPAASKQA